MSTIKKEQVTDVITTSIPAAIRILHKSIAKRDPVFLWGAPGIGKSDIVYQAADACFAEAYADTHVLLPNPKGGRTQCKDLSTGQFCKRPWLRDVRALLHEPVDFGGIPHVDDDGITRFHPTNLLPLQGFADPRGGVVFLDELSNAEPQVSNALLGWVLDGEIAGHLRQEGWVDIAASNRQKDGTFSKRLSKAMGSRFATHLELAVSMDAFVEWGLNNGMKGETLAFVRLRPELIHDFDATLDGHSFPCPRTWHKADAWVGELAREDELPFFSGLLGKGAAVEFISFLRDYEDMISPDVCITDPKGAALPKKPSQMYAMCGAMSRRVTKENVDRVFEYMLRMPLEFQVVWLKDAVRLSPAISMCKAFTQWFTTNGKLLC